jgi:hypothetical protein
MFTFIWTVDEITYCGILLKARIVEVEKQSLLAMALKQHSFLGSGHEKDNGMMSFARQQILNKQE